MKKQTETVDPLQARRRDISRALYDHKQTPGGTLEKEQRLWLEREKSHYDEGGDMDSWYETYQRIKALYAKADAAAAERQAAAEADKAAGLAKMKEHDDALRARLAEETDPVTVWKRQHAARTF